MNEKMKPTTELHCICGHYKHEHASYPEGCLNGAYADSDSDTYTNPCDCSRFRLEQSDKSNE